MLIKFSRLFANLFGNPEQLSLEQRLFHALCFCGTIALLLGALFQLIFDLSVTSLIIIIIMAAGFSISYYFSRFRFQYHRVLWPVLLLLFTGLTFLWFKNGGIKSSIPFFFLAGGLASILAVKGIGRKIIGILYIIALISLPVIEYFGPELVSSFQSKSTQYLDQTFGLILSFLLLIATIFFLCRNFYEMFNRLQEHKTEFYEDLVLARILQEQILAYEPEIIEDFDVSLYYLPSAELSGDLYDFSRLKSLPLRIFLADAKGHGINSSLSSMLIKSEWMNINRIYLTPGNALTALNRRIIERYGDSISFTAILIDIRGEKIIYASAGHPAQYIVHDQKVVTLEATGSPIGYIDDADYTEEELIFPEDGRLVLFTDAMTEEIDRNNRAIGSDWILESLTTNFSSSAHLSKIIINQLARLKDQPREALSCSDDLTLIVAGSKIKES